MTDLPKGLRVNPSLSLSLSLSLSRPPSCTHSLTPSFPHSLIPTFPHSLTPSLPHSLIPSLPPHSAAAQVHSTSAWVQERIKRPEGVNLKMLPRLWAVHVPHKYHRCAFSVLPTSTYVCSGPPSLTHSLAHSLTHSLSAFLSPDSALAEMIHMLATQANAITESQKRKTITPQDIVAALKVCRCRCSSSSPPSHSFLRLLSAPRDSFLSLSTSLSQPLSTSL